MRRLLAAAAISLAMCGGAQSTAYASCGVLPGSGPTTLANQINAAPIAFVGTVVGTANNDRVARVKVESIWKGPVVPTLVTVSGTPDQGSAATSVDRTFQVGRRYLFLPFTASSPFQDNSCSATQIYSSRLDSFQPATAQPPGPGSAGPDPTASPFASWTLPGITALLIAGAAVWILARRRRGPGPVAFNRAALEVELNPTSRGS
jgi:hypothetical protein